MSKWVVILFVFLLFLSGIFAFYLIRKNPVKTEIKGPISVILDKQDSTDIKVSDKEAVKDYLSNINPLNAEGIIVNANFVNSMPAETGSDISNFWPQSEFGVGGLACGKPKVSSDGNKVEFNFYITKDFVIGKLGVDEAVKQSNEYFRYCLVKGVFAGLNLSKEEAAELYKSLIPQYEDKIFLTFN